MAGEVTREQVDELIKSIKELSASIEKFTNATRDLNARMEKFSALSSRLEIVANLMSTNAQKFNELSVKMERTINEVKHVADLLTQEIEEVYDEISTPEEEKITDPTARRVYKYLRSYVRKTGNRFIDVEDIARNLRVSEDEVIEAIAVLVNSGIPVRLTTVKEEKGGK